MTLLALALAVSSVFAQEPFRKNPGEVLSPAALEALEAVSKNDTAGLGAEARKIKAWTQGREKVELAPGRLISGADGLEIGGTMAAALARLNQYFGLTAAT